VKSLGTGFVVTLISIGRKALTFQSIAVVAKKLHLMTTCARKIECPLLLVRLLKESSVVYSMDKFVLKETKKKDPHLAVHITAKHWKGTIIIIDIVNC